MKAPDDISDYHSGSQSDVAHYSDNNGGGFDSNSLDSLSSAEGEVTSQDTGGGLEDLLRGRNVYLLRHGKTAKAPKDEDRPLAPLAEKQCASFLSTYSAELDRVFYVFSSPAVRAVATANLLGFPVPTRVPDLYFANYSTDEIRKIENELGYTAPLAEYLQVNEGKGKEVYAPVRTRLRRALETELAKALEKAQKIGEWEGDVLVVTHATTVSLVAMEVLEAIKAGLGEEKEAEGGVCPEEDKILTFNAGEVEGFKVTSDGKVQLLRVEESQAPTGKNDDFVEKA